MNAGPKRGPATRTKAARQNSAGSEHGRAESTNVARLAAGPARTPTPSPVAETPWVPMLDLTMLDFEKRGGLVTVVTQDARTGVVLMVAHADREALERTIATRQMHYRSRRRGLWHKGATSGNTQAVVSLTPDCDGDVVLARVIPAGPACHTNETSCFGVKALGPDSLSELDAVIAQRANGK